MNPNLRRRKGLIVAIAATCLALSPAVAQSAAPLSQLPPVLRTFVGDLKEALNLTPPQQAQFALALARTEEVLPQIRAGHANMLAAARSELQKDIPDLAALAQEKDGTELANLALRQSARTEWLRLYAMLTPDQVAVLKQHLGTVLGRIEALRQWLPFGELAAS